MPHLMLAATVLACLALAACAEEEPVPCPAPDYESLVGTNIAAVTLPADLETRIYEEGSALTQDFRPERMNIETDSAGRILRLWCG